MRIEGVPSGLRPYWRGEVYTTFAGGQWRSTGDLQAQFAANEPIPADVPALSGELLTVQVTPLLTGDDMLFAPGRPLLTSIVTRVRAGTPGSGAEPDALYAANELRPAQATSFARICLPWRRRADKPA